MPFESNFFLVQRGGGKKNNCSTVDCGHDLQADVRSAHADLDVPVDFLIHAADTAEIWVGFSIWEKKPHCSIKRFKDITHHCPDRELMGLLCLCRNVLKLDLNYAD